MTRPVLSAIALAIVAAACGSSSSSGDATTADPTTSSSGTSGTSGTTSSGSSGTSGSSGSSGQSSSGSDSGADSGTDAPLTVFTIVMENHDYDEIVGSSNAPYFNPLMAEYGLATNYNDSLTHPSLPNYLDMISGNTQYPGIVDLEPTNFPFPVTKDNLGTQLEAAKIPWRAYQESMTTPCTLADDGDYAPRHDPFLYFSDMRDPTFCADHNVNYTQFATDLAAGTYRYMWITPNLTDDGHNPANDPVSALKTCDAWAAANVPAILASEVFKANGVLFITWDEAEGRNGQSGDQIPMIVISPRIKSAGYKSSTQYTHASYLATLEDLFGLPRLATVTSTPSMLEFLK